MGGTELGKKPRENGSNDNNDDESAKRTTSHQGRMRKLILGDKGRGEVNKCLQKHFYFNNFIML